ncbi:hypothetical protein [Streptomyces sp. NPDC049040]|uniref:hypothetical protein n=1 Tax=Streptomyces sp. NPDC049040 TaxID=3365593 RepID=UPI0037241C4B
MEFTISRRLRRRGAGLVWAAVAGFAGLAAWVAARGMPEGTAGPLCVLGLAVLCAIRGTAELRRARKPFRLRIDGFGMTLHDAELSWEQIDAVALHYRESGEDSAPAKPRLVLWTAPGVKLPRKADRGYEAWFAEALGVPREERSRYTLLDTDDLDQGVTALGAALAEHGGARFETAPRSVRTPTPVTVSGPERRVPGMPAQVFTAHGSAGPWALLCLVAALACSEPLVAAVAGWWWALVPVVLLGPSFAAAAALWWATARLYGRWHRPRRFSVGPDGLAAQAPGGAEVRFSWAQVAALTVGPHPSSPDGHDWLVIWPLPGAHLPPTATFHLVDGHQSCPLTRLDLLPGGPAAILPHVRAFAGERLDSGFPPLP